MSELFKRILFGIVFLGVVFAPIYADLKNGSSLFVLTLFLFSILGVHEIHCMSEKINHQLGKSRIPSMLAAFAIYLPFLIFGAQFFLPNLSQNLFLSFLFANSWLVLGIYFVCIAIVILMSTLIFKMDNIRFLLEKPFILSFIYPTLLFWIVTAFYCFSTSSNARVLIIVILLPIYLNDSFAYVCGRLFGKTPLIPKVSPKKTVEGFLGGIIVTMCVMCFLIYVFGELNTNNVLKICGISLLASILATLGDLFESKLKRSAGVKDSGKIIPGHGGILDRVDAMLFVTPVLSILLLFFE
jgi:phosphatidate cytidylyltransferase